MTYSTIVADPPWEYESFVQGTTGDVGSLHVPLPYPSLPVAEIAAMNVRTLAATNCWLFCWTTNKYLRDAFAIVEAWGFTYTQTITWRKTGDPPPFVHSVAPQHSEHLLVARCGRPRRHGAFPSSVIDAPAQDEHSRKPEAFLDYIEAIGEPARLELFSRRPRFGWETWGDEALAGTWDYEAVPA